MAASTTAQAPSSASLVLGIVGLLAFAVLSGIGVAVGEFDAMIIAVTMIAAAAALVDFRVGAVLMIVMLPLEGSTFFPGGMFGITGLNPMNLMLAATLASYLLRGRFRTFLPKPLLWLFMVPIVIAGLIGTQHVDRIYPYFYEMEVVHYIDAFGYLRDEVVKPLFMALTALLIAAAVERSHNPDRFITPIVVAVWARACASARSPIRPSAPSSPPWACTPTTSAACTRWRTPCSSSPGGRPRTWR
jgi:hypothetical protein